MHFSATQHNGFLGSTTNFTSPNAPSPKIFTTCAFLVPFCSLLGFGAFGTGIPAGPTQTFGSANIVRSGHHRRREIDLLLTCAACATDADSSNADNDQSSDSLGLDVCSTAELVETFAVASQFQTTSYCYHLLISANECLVRSRIRLLVECDERLWRAAAGVAKRGGST